MIENVKTCLIINTKFIGKNRLEMLDGYDSYIIIGYSRIAHCDYEDEPVYDYLVNVKGASKPQVIQINNSTKLYKAVCLMVHVKRFDTHYFAYLDEYTKSAGKIDLTARYYSAYIGGRFSDVDTVEEAIEVFNHVKEIGLTPTVYVFGTKGIDLKVKEYMESENILSTVHTIDGLVNAKMFTTLFTILHRTILDSDLKDYKRNAQPFIYIE